MRSRAFVSSVSILACALGCATTQDLGSFQGGDDGADTGVDPGTASDPRAGFLGVLPLDVEACPAVAPAPGDDCSGAQHARECMYEERTIDQVGHAVCGRSCVCARDKTWKCAAAPCANLDSDTCSEGTACVGDVRCWAHCDGPGGTCVSCACRAGRMSCRDLESPPR